MKHIRIIALSLALVLMLGLLAACGKSGSESGSVSQPDASISLPEGDVSNPDVSTPDASQPEDETPAPETKPEVKPEVKPEEKPVAPDVKPEAKPEVKPESPAPAPGSDETIPLPLPEARPEEQPEQKPAVDLEAFYQTIFTDPDNSPAMEAFPTEGLDAFYPGLTNIAANQRVAYMASMTAVACEIIMVECANATDVDAVKTILQSRIDSQVNNHFNYPMVIEAWETEATVVSNGNFVALFVVSGMTDQVVSSFNALF